MPFDELWFAFGECDPNVTGVFVCCKRVELVDQFLAHNSLLDPSVIMLWSEGLDVKGSKAMIPSMAAGTDPAEIAGALDEAGCVVVTGLLNEERREQVRTELAPFMAETRVLNEDDPKEFYPAKTRRMSALVTHSDAVGELVLDSHAQDLCDRFLLPNAEFGHQLHVSAALEVGPGARRQVLHREHDTFSYFPDPKPNIIVASMWAITDFRADNGATLVVPGSHRWDADRVAREEEVLAAEMPAGSVLF